MAVETVRLVLGEHHNLAKTRIDQIRQGEVDESIVATEGHRRLRAVSGERHEALALSASENNAKDLLRCHLLTVEERLRCVSLRTALAFDR